MPIVARSTIISSVQADGRTDVLFEFIDQNAISHYRRMTLGVGDDEAATRAAIEVGVNDGLIADEKIKHLSNAKKGQALGTVEHGTRSEVIQYIINELKSFTTYDEYFRLADTITGLSDQDLSDAYGLNQPQINAVRSFATQLIDAKATIDVLVSPI